MIGKVVAIDLLFGKVEQIKLWVDLLLMMVSFPHLERGEAEA